MMSQLLKLPLQLVSQLLKLPLQLLIHLTAAVQHLLLSEFGSKMYAAAAPVVAASGQKSAQPATA